VEEGADEAGGRGSEEIVRRRLVLVVAGVMVVVVVVVVLLLLGMVREGLLHLEQEVCGEEGGGHAIGGHWLHHRSGRSMGGVYQSQREREGEVG